MREYDASKNKMNNVINRLINQAFIFGLFALLAGVFYREFTKFNGFTGNTALAFVHPHLFALGTFLCLILVLFYKHFPLPKYKKFNIFLNLYSIALPFMAIMMVVRGVLQVLGTELSKGLDASISGIAGISHILLAIAFIYLFLSIKEAIKEDSKL